jgi:competence protein ComEC
MKGSVLLAYRRNGKNSVTSILVGAIVCFLVVFLTGKPGTGGNTQQAKPTSVQPGESLVYFLDVGQGDCELIRLKTGENILIDAGTPDTAQKLVSVLKQLGVEKIDLLVATHPHADHIGGMAQVVKSFPIGKIYMPKVADSQIPTTATYEKLLNAIDSKSLKIIATKGGMTILENGDEKLETLAPNSSKYEDLNNYSIVLKLTCGEKSFLFAGDAQTESEKEMASQGYSLKSDVLKCGHHGSSTSTGAALLKAVSPGAAVISCGVDNDYGHPSKTVLNRLQKGGITVYRTEQQGTILARCDGKDIKFSTGEPSAVK